MNALLDSICRAGLNRARIHDALASIDQFDGVTGHMVFDPNQKNVAPMYLGTVHEGTITYRVATMEKAAVSGDEPPGSQNRDSSTSSGQAPVRPDAVPYARVGEDGVSYAGPHLGDVPPGRVHVVVFGPQAASVSQSAQAALRAASGQPWDLVPVDSNQNWGAASTQLVHALFDEHALAIVALDRNAAHLAEQLALKALVPVIAVSGDRSLTATNVPWIFRMPPQATPAAALQLLRSAEQQSGPNPERLRDVLASGHPLDGFAFLPTGEPKAQ
jgi:phosphoribosylcarboxyaminoimidazole (NCAIR) mutase